MPWSPHLTKLSGGSHYISKNMKNYSSKKKQLALKSPVITETKPIYRRDLGSHPAQIQLKSPFHSTWDRTSF